MFGFGNGQTGQNSAVATTNLTANYNYSNPIPMERPFRSLSYPDINFTIMRPAALPPSLQQNTTPGSNPSMVVPQNNSNDVRIANAQAVQYTYYTGPAAPTTLPPTPISTPTGTNGWVLIPSALPAGNAVNCYAPFVMTNNVTAVAPPYPNTGTQG